MEDTITPPNNTPHFPEWPVINRGKESFGDLMRDLKTSTKGGSNLSRINLAHLIESLSAVRQEQLEIILTPEINQSLERLGLDRTHFAHERIDEIRAEINDLLKTNDKGPKPIKEMSKQAYDVLHSYYLLLKILFDDGIPAFWGFIADCEDNSDPERSKRTFIERMDAFGKTKNVDW